MTRAQYISQVKRKLLAQGYQPVRAIYDAGGNCVICGEAGRCPGWHTERQHAEIIPARLEAKGGA